MKFKGRAFTLMLLVVTVIVAISEAILMPVFSAARTKAQQAAGLHNERQIAIAVRMYAGDYDERKYLSSGNPSACGSRPPPVKPEQVQRVW